MRVAELLDAGARIYVCGDGKRMAPAVRETLAKIADVDQLEATGRIRVVRRDIARIKFVLSERKRSAAQQPKA